MKTQMTGTAWLQGFRNAAICAIGVLAMVTVVAFGFSSLTGSDFRDSRIITTLFFFYATLAWFVYTLIGARRKRGEVLLDCGYHPARILFLVNAVLFAFVGLREVFSSDASPDITTALFWMTVSCFSILMSFGRLQIAENGIWQYWGLLKWQDIESYTWRGKGASTLMVQKKGKFSFLRGALPVPAARRQSVSELLGKFACQNSA